MDKQEKRKLQKKLWRLANLEAIKAKDREYKRLRYIPSPRVLLTPEEKLDNKLLSRKAFSDSIAGKYTAQKIRAKQRGIEWEFNLDSWFKVWTESGKWPERGTKAYQYCMCRYGDTGPYSIDNTYIDTVSNNAKMSHVFKNLNRGI